VVLSSGANSIARSRTADTNIVTLIPQAAEFLASGNQAKILSDERSYVALRIWLEPDNPASAIQVVIGFTT
jgi:hypothetical protein